MTSAHVFEVTTANFEADVLVRSKETPVLLDFWAAWCEPCKTLTPALEKAAESYAGAFVLGKVDIEALPELAQAFQVQSIPFCLLLVDGRPVNAFQGAIAESDIVSFLTECGVAPQPPDDQAEEDVEDPDAPEARFRDGKLAAMRADVIVARERLEGVPEEFASFAEGRRILEGLEIFDRELDSSEAAAAGLLKGREELGGGNYDGAIEGFLEAVAVDKAYAEGLGRRAILLSIALMGETEETEERIVDFRRRLGTLLF